MRKSTRPSVPRRGIKMRHGSGWRLIKPGINLDRDVIFKGSLLATYNFGERRIAIFSVPKGK